MLKSVKAERNVSEGASVGAKTGEELVDDAVERIVGRGRTRKTTSAKKPRSRKAPGKAQLKREATERRNAQRARTRSVVAVVMPCFALSATVQAGHLLQHGAPLAVVGLVAAIAAGVYWTSIPHVAKGLERACHLDLTAAWAMALAIDGAVVAGELARMYGGIEALAWAMMTLGVILSAVFNRIGFEAE